MSSAPTEYPIASCRHCRKRVKLSTPYSYPHLVYQQSVRYRPASPLRMGCWRYSEKRFCLDVSSFRCVFFVIDCNQVHHVFSISEGCCHLICSVLLIDDFCKTHSGEFIYEFLHDLLIGVLLT